MGTKKSVCIVGAGISGLTCAHELSLRGFDINVYEQSGSIGGKAKSGISPMGYPTEHGHRFYGSYTNFFQTMEQLATVENKTVKDNLTPVPIHALFKDYTPITYSSTSSLFRPLYTLLNLFKFGQRVRFRNMLHFSKLLLLFLKGDKNYKDQLREIDFQSLIQAHNKDANFYRYIARWSQFLWGVSAQEGNAYTTINSIAVTNKRHLKSWSQDIFYPVMNAPSSDALFEYWRKWLDRNQVHLCFDHQLIKIETEGDTIKNLVFESPQGTKIIEADYYILAIPCDKLPMVLGDNLKKQIGIDDVFAQSTYPFNGVQLYLQGDYHSLAGVAIYTDSPWCISACFQNNDLWANHYFKPPVTGILSVVLGDWSSEGIIYKKSIINCTRNEIIEEIVAQIAIHKPIHLGMSHLVDYYIDDALNFSEDGKLISIDNKNYSTPIGRYYDQPTSTTALDNLFLAGDYLQTGMINGTMESANISGKMAANAVIKASGVKVHACSILENSYF